MAKSSNIPQPIHHLLWLLAIASLTFLFLHLAATNLANYHPVSGDDGWIMSASYKLASEATFGSDMYAGFYNADQHYFIALPVYHLLQAASFKLFGLGVFQARLPNLFSAILLIWLTTSLANRYLGRKPALLTAALLIFLCPGLTTTEPCTQLLIYAHNGRYDLTATTLAWAAIWQLDNYIRQSTPKTAFILGLLIGLASLTQFFGAFVLIPTAIVQILRWGKTTLRRHTLYYIAAGFLITIGPYLIYITAYFDDFIGQSILKSGRSNFLDPKFYIDNLFREGERFTTLLQPLQSAFPNQLPFQTIMSLLIFIGVITAFIILLKRTRPANKIQLPIPWISALGLFLGLILFEQTKAPVYTILLLPAICLALAAATKTLLHSANKPKQPWPLRIAIALPALLILFFLFQSGLNSHRRLIEVTRNTTPYQAIADQIKTHLTPGAVVLGSERWWPGLVDYDYLSINNLWTQWRLAEANGRSPQFSQQVQTVSAEYIIVDINIRGNLSRQPDQLQNQYRDYLSTCGALLADWENQSYARIQIYQLNC